MMKNRKRIAIAIGGVVLVGIICVVFLLPKLNFDVSSVAGNPSQVITSEEDMREMLLEYADYGLTYDADTKTFYYDGQLVKKIDDGKHYYHTNSKGAVKISVSRDSDGKITNLNVK